jgi:hypothetical protein
MPAAVELDLTDCPDLNPALGQGLLMGATPSVDGRWVILTGRPSTTGTGGGACAYDTWTDTMEVAVPAADHDGMFVVRIAEACEAWLARQGFGPRLLAVRARRAPRGAGAPARCSGCAASL